MRLLTLVLVLASSSAWSQIQVLEGKNGVKTFTNLPSECVNTDPDVSQEVRSKCASFKPKSTNSSTSKEEQQKISKLKIAEGKLKKAEAERDVLQQKMDGLRKQRQLNPKDIAAKKAIEVYSKKLSEKNNEVSSLQQRVFFIKLANTFKGESE